MPSAVLCHVNSDLKIATELASFLHTNCVTMTFEKEVIGASNDLIGAAERALSADYVLLLLSPDSAPRKWIRERWEPILVEEARKFGTQVVYVLVSPCGFPRLFRLNPFFDLSENWIAGGRDLKRWLLRRDPLFHSVIKLPERCPSTAISSAALAELECQLADQPGVQADIDRELALTFAHTHAADFEAALWIDCANRSHTGVLGDTAQALGLRLRGKSEQNAQALREFCAKRRILLLFDNLKSGYEQFLGFGGKASVLFVTANRSPHPRSLAQMSALFSSWRENPGACLSALGEVQGHLGNLPACSGADWQLAISVGSAASACLRHAGRLAEAYELLELIADTVRDRGDPFGAAKYDWEKSWILEEWGEPVPPRLLTAPASAPIQLSLEF